MNRRCEPGRHGYVTTGTKQTNKCVYCGHKQAPLRGRMVARRG